MTSHHDRWLVIAGPVSSYSWDLYRCIAERHGIDLAVVHRAPPEQGNSQFRHETFEPRGIEACDYAKVSATELIRFIEARPVGAILVFSMVSRLPLFIALRRRRPATPTIFASDTNIKDVIPRTLKGWGRVAIYRFMSRMVTEAWTLGQSNEEAFRLFGMKRIRPLPFYAVNFSDFGPPRQEVSPSKREAFRLLVVARLAPEKNVLALVEAVSSPRLRKRVVLDIVGDGPERTIIEKRIAEGADNVSVLGALPHRALGAVLRNADALVLPSTREPWGNVVVEALGQGIPVLATPAVGAAVSLAARYAGIRVAAGSSVADLEDAILALLGDDNKAASAAVKDVPRIRAEFDTEAVASKMVRAMRELQGRPALVDMSS